ncbi:MAG: ATP-binding cassette domain-containing protein [Turicibacter sp.]|nr:ATP-binding cassette domain-containing protein [Turicibacter sp.]
MGYAIEVKDLTKNFGDKQVIKKVSLSVKAGEIIGFLGPSGAGKSTVIKLLTGQIKQDFGRASVLGKDTRGLDHNIYEQIGIVSDKSGLYKDMTAYGNLLLFAKILKVDKKVIPQLLD